MGLLQRLSDTLPAEPSTLVVLRSLMHGSIASADVVGVLGLWNPIPSSVEDLVGRLSKGRERIRGASGWLRGVDYLMQMASASLLDGQIVASAHLYFSVLSHLEPIIGAADRVDCLTARPEAVEVLRRRFPAQQFRLIPVGMTAAATHDGSFPMRVSEEMGQDLTGVLCLIGAGPWAEIYRTWAKERGGVGVDIGSAFDLLAGSLTRPVHHSIETDDLLEAAGFARTTT